MARYPPIGLCETDAIDLAIKKAPVKALFSGAPGMARSALTGAVPDTVVVAG